MRCAKFAADNILNFLFIMICFSEKINFDISCESSHEMSRLFSEKIKTKLFSSAVVTGVLRVK